MSVHYTTTFLMMVLILASVSGSDFICPKHTKGSTVYFQFEATVSYVGNETLTQDDWSSVDETVQHATTTKYLSSSHKSPEEIVAKICHDGGIRRHLRSNDGEIRGQNLQAQGVGHHRGLVVIDFFVWVGRASELWDVCFPSRSYILSTYYFDHFSMQNL